MNAIKEILADPNLGDAMADTKAGTWHYDWLYLKKEASGTTVYEFLFFTADFFFMLLFHHTASEVRALHEFYKCLKDDPEKATYGPK